MKKLEKTIKILEIVKSIIYVIVGIPFIIISVLMLSDVFKK